MKKAIYLLLAIVGLLGLFSVLAITLIKSSVSTVEWFILILAAAVSMIFLAIGVYGFDREILLKRYPRTPEGREKFIRESLSGKKKVSEWLREFYNKHLS